MHSCQSKYYLVNRSIYHLISLSVTSTMFWEAIIQVLLILQTKQPQTKKQKQKQMNSGHCSLVRFVIVVRVKLYLLLFVNFTKCCHRDMNTPLLSSISQSGSRCCVSVQIRAHLLSPISSVIKSGLTGGAASLAPISTPVESGLRERAASQASIREMLKEIDIFKG